MLRQASRVFVILSFFDWLFTTWAFVVYVNPPFNPIAVYLWSLYGLPAWTIWKIFNASVVYFGLNKVYYISNNEYAKFFVIFAFSGLIIALLGAVMQEWFYIGWIDFAPHTVSFFTR